jgi:dual-specificity kinase
MLAVPTGDALFQTHENLEHLAMMERVLGQIPDSLISRANKATAKYFNKNRSDKHSHVWC